MKIILTEQQFDKLSLFLVESKFETFLKKNAKIGDIIKIYYKNTTSSFKVLSNDIGQITMDCIDAGVNKNYRFFLVLSSLSGNKLKISKVHKINEKDKLNDVKLWKEENLNDVKNIELVRAGKVIDTVDELKSNGLPDNNNNVGDFEKDISNKLNYLLNELKKGKGLIMKMTNNEELLYCCLEKNSKSFTLELKNKTKIKDLSKWDSFVITLNNNPDNEDENLYELNKGNIKTKEGGKSFDILTKARSGNITKNIFITGILGFSVTPNCKSTEEENPNDKKIKKEKPNNEQPLKNTEEEAKKLMDAIINDPLMRNAFYKEPDLWNLISSAAKGEKPEGTGILPAMQIVNRYYSNEINKNLCGRYRNFKNKKELTFVYKGKDNEIYKNNQIYTAILNLESYKNYIKLKDVKNDVEITLTSCYRVDNESIKNGFNVNIEKEIFNNQTNKKEKKIIKSVIDIEDKKDSGYYTGNDNESEKTNKLT